MREVKSRFQTDSGIELEPFYRPDTNPADIGAPGEFPYTRGVQPTMYRGRLWTMRQYAGFGSAAETNRRFKYLLSQGQTEIVMRRGEFRLQPDGFLEFVMRPFEFAALKVDAAQGVVGLGRARIGAQRRPHSPFSLAPVLFERGEDTQIVVRRVIVGINGQEVI